MGWAARTNHQTRDYKPPKPLSEKAARDEQKLQVPLMLVLGHFMGFNWGLQPMRKAKPKRKRAQKAV